MDIVNILAVSVATAAGLWGIRHWALAYANAAVRASTLIDRAYGAATRLMDDPEAPESVIRFIPAFMAGAGRPGLARGFAWRLLLGRISKASDRSPAGMLAHDLERLSAGQKAAFMEFVIAVMMSSAAVDPFFPRLFISAVQRFVSISGREDAPPSVERTETMAADFAAHSPALLAA